MRQASVERRRGMGSDDGYENNCHSQVSEVGLYRC